MTPEASQLRSILLDGRLEIRAFEHADVWSGVFDNYTSLRHEIRFAMSRSMEIYNTLNPVTLPATNKLERFKRSTRDKEVSIIRRIPFDFDPVRGTGEPATDIQVEQARNTANRMINFLHGEGWGDPVVGMSGNGWHAIYTTSLPNTVETQKALRKLYQAFALRFTTDEVKFDVVVRNPARIFRTYGTDNQKCGRRSYCNNPAPFHILGDAVLELANRLMPEKAKRTWVQPAQKITQKGYIPNLDVVRLFESNGLYLMQTSEIDKHWVICPWEGEHTETGNTDTVIWEGKWPQFHCSHAHCSHRTILDVINFFGVDDAVA